MNRAVFAGAAACLVCLLSSCISYRANSAVAPAPEPAVDSPPTIRVILNAEGTDDPVTRRQLYRALYDSASASDVMRGAVFQPNTGLKVNYVLLIDAHTGRSGYGWLAPDLLLFFGILPAVTTNEIAVTATLYEAATTHDLTTFKANGKLKTIWWLLLLPAAPVSLASHNSIDAVYHDTFRDVFSQLANDVAGRSLPAPVADSDWKRIEPVPQIRIQQSKPRPAPTD